MKRATCELLGPPRDRPLSDPPFRRAPLQCCGAEALDAGRLAEIERQAIFQALQKHNLNRTETAKALGISRRALIYKLQRLRELGYLVDPVSDGLGDMEQ